MKLKTKSILPQYMPVYNVHGNIFNIHLEEDDEEEGGGRGERWRRRMRKCFKEVCGMRRMGGTVRKASESWDEEMRMTVK